jgi:hypothetical protein
VLQGQSAVDLLLGGDPLRAAAPGEADGPVQPGGDAALEADDVEEQRPNKEIKRRTDVDGVFPDPEALLRLAGAMLVEVHDEWQVSDRRYLSEGSMAMPNRPSPAEEVAQPALMASWSPHR